MKTKHTIKTPLSLIWHEELGTYKVNKPNQGTQELVSKEIAEELLEALKYARRFMNDNSDKAYVDEIIKKATE